MKPIKQTDISLETGDCLRACVASLLELELDDVPNFGALGGDWWRQLQDWFAQKNLNVSYSFDRMPIGSWHIASVKSPRFEGATHAVVCNPDCEIVHDPHPDVDDPSINSKPFGWYWITPIDPALSVV